MNHPLNNKRYSNLADRASILIGELSKTISLFNKYLEVKLKEHEQSHVEGVAQNPFGKADDRVNDMKFIVSWVHDQLGVYFSQTEFKPQSENPLREALSWIRNKYLLEFKVPAKGFTGEYLRDACIAKMEWVDTKEDNYGNLPPNCS